MSTARPAVTSRASRHPWIFDLTPQERSTLVATFGGWALDGMDVMVYSFVIPADRSVAHQQGTSGHAGYGRSADFSRWRLAGRIAGGPLRPRTHPADHHSMVCVLHVPKRIHQLVLATADDARPARPGFRRGVGGRLRADG